MKTFVITLIAVLLFGCTPQTEKLTPKEAKEIAKEAYIYGFPIVMNYKTLYAFSLEKRSPEYKSELNQKFCEARLTAPDDKTVVTPNSDTPYCTFWCDISAEPIVISVPEVEANRYYSFQLIDLYTHNFAYIGNLSTGSQAGSYLIAPEGWKGETPESIRDVIYCETSMFFNVVRTQLMNDNDLDRVKEIQSNYKVQTLSEYNGAEASETPVVENFPAWIEGEQFNINAFKYLDFMLDFIDPIDSEKPLMEKFAKIGLGTDAEFNATQFDSKIVQALKDGVAEGFAEIEAFKKNTDTDPLFSTKMFGTREFLTQSARKYYNLDNFYLPRAVAAHVGLYGNSAFEAIYPSYLTDSEGLPLDASANRYSITFKADELPPVKSFWSITMYDGKTQLLIENPIDRYLVNSSMMDNYVFGDDGSLTIYIQKESPGAELEANWLPAPDGPFYVAMRLYGPEEVALSGEWTNPPMVKNN
ncbi:DUF1254 domain-containing protein [uncultured Draconibacterium sp.]|uniref:DUF1254 domain-containing protein n=1 Tax=uncultured Draconibacterium sp. TaxID=1573823 RepID=UPI002AA80F97|nr:DUF1254 domain-containing protein [uncultured Draconibacterium sp.]